MLALDPGAVFAFTMLAAALHEEKDATGVEAIARAFLAHSPDLYAGHFWLGVARGQLGDPAGAATALLAAADRFRPDDADADDCRLVAEHLAWAGRPMAALHLLTRSLAARPDWATGPERLRAKAAALAVRCGTGDAADAPPADARPQLVHQALEWLAADLTYWQARRETAPAAAHAALGEWLTAPDLAPVRHPLTVMAVAPAEWARWRRRWADARALYAATAPEAAPPPRPVR